MAGLPVLLEAIATTIKSTYGRTILPTTELLVTAGATQGIFTTIQALVGFGDEVVIIDPAYDCYEPAIILAGGKPIHVAMKADFTIDWLELRNVISQKTKLLIVNNPHNPSGRVMNQADLDSLTNVMRDYPNLLLLSDEVYEYITYEQAHLSANLVPEIYDRTIIISSFGKTFHITGWKMGYLVAPEKLMVEIKKVHQFLVFSVNSVAQKTLADYLSQTDVSSLGAFYQQKRSLFQNGLTNSKFKLLPSEGTYFQTADYSQISSENDVQFCEWLTREKGVAAIPLSVFYEHPPGQHIIRFCYAKTDETLLAATERLCAI
jgi:methionine aminotransferase